MTARIWWWACAVAAVRVCALWYLLFREWTHQQSISTLPLVLLLYPEGLLLSEPVVWTARLAVMFSVALIAGSFLWVGIVAAVAALVRGARPRP